MIRQDFSKELWSDRADRHFKYMHTSETCGWASVVYIGSYRVGQIKQGQLTFLLV